jgi:hypothetical protein
MICTWKAISLYRGCPFFDSHDVKTGKVNILFRIAEKDDASSSRTNGCMIRSWNDIFTIIGRAYFEWNERNGVEKLSDFFNHTSSTQLS